MGALSFSTPLILLALIALPAIWILLRATPPKPTEVVFPAFEILRRLTRTEETPDRTPWPLLLLRILIAAIVIFALAGPLYDARPSKSENGPVVLVVDNSWAAAAHWRDRKAVINAIAEDAERARREIYFIPTVLAHADSIEPLTGSQLRQAASALEPKPLLPDYSGVSGNIDDSRSKLRDAEVIWLSDGLRHEGQQALRDKLSNLGRLTVYREQTNPILVLKPALRSEGAQKYSVEKIGGGSWSGAVVAQTSDGRELARSEASLHPDDATAEVKIDLPLVLQNEVASVRIDTIPSAGAVQLVDARARRALIGIVATGNSGVDPLLSGAHYVRRALEPYAQFIEDSLENLISSDASVIVLDDIGKLRANDAAALTEWVQKGGVLVRFAGPTLAEAAADGTPPLLPVKLRGGGRAFGGALTWETPQNIGSFAPDGPFAGLLIPKDIFVRRQVLAEPGGETSEHSWASLADGTPLVTGKNEGAGAVVLFHITATPDWSDLPLSSLFVEMLRKLTFLSSLGPKTATDASKAKLSPVKILDGYGALKPPPENLAPQSLDDLTQGPSPDRPPGLYGAPEAPVAVNAVSATDKFEAASFSGATEKDYGGAQTIAVAPYLYLIALVLLLADAIIALRIAGKLFAVLALAATLVVLLPAPTIKAQPLDQKLDPKAVAAALDTRLAYVKTGDPSTDRVSEAGLSALSRKLAERTSLEPAAPAALDLETGDLSVYPFLYWPMTPGASAPSDNALAKIESYMKLGGLVVFDTRDDERAIGNIETPERLALKSILANLDLPPLTPLSRDHVLTRSFYLVPDLVGRENGGLIWVETKSGANDSVTPIIIGGRDWAGAWAADDINRPLLPMTEGGERARELSYRAGINMVMVALTGNYKSDQVHTPILLERLGKQ
ncbi:MAG: DUF4159 domain-containing protein [Parvularculaceae bacterium]